MVEIASRQSPLGEWAPRFAAVAPAILLSEVPFTTILNLRVRVGSAASAAVEAALGLELPRHPRHVGAIGHERAIWLAPDEFLVTSSTRSASDLGGLITAALGDRANGALVDTSAQFTVITLAGPESRDLLAGGCSTDLSPEQAPTGMSVHTPLAQASVILVVADAAAGAFLLIVRASFADYLASWLTTMAREYS